MCVNDVCVTALRPPPPPPPPTPPTRSLLLGFSLAAVAFRLDSNVRSMHSPVEQPYSKSSAALLTDFLFFFFPPLAGNSNLSGQSQVRHVLPSPVICTLSFANISDNIPRESQLGQAFQSCVSPVKSLCPPLPDAFFILQPLPGCSPVPAGKMTARFHRLMLQHVHSHLRHFLFKIISLCKRASFLSLRSQISSETTSK